MPQNASLRSCAAASSWRLVWSHSWLFRVPLPPFAPQRPASLSSVMLPQHSTRCGGTAADPLISHGCVLFGKLPTSESRFDRKSFVPSRVYDDDADFKVCVVWWCCRKLRNRSAMFLSINFINGKRPFFYYTIIITHC